MLYKKHLLSMALINLNFVLPRFFSDIQNILIPIYEEFPLNGVKYLDYLAFKEANYIKLDPLKSDKLDLIIRTNNNMNSARVDFKFPSSHTIRITPY